jgi:hypothetical protein
MRFTTSLLCSMAALLGTTLADPEPDPQIAAGGGIAPATLQPSQFPVVSQLNSLTTQAGGSVVAVQGKFLVYFKGLMMRGEGEANMERHRDAQREASPHPSGSGGKGRGQRRLHCSRKRIMRIKI